MEKDYVVLEVEGLRNKGDMYPIVMMTLANQVSSEFFKTENRTYKKMFGIDEAWMVFDNEIVVKFLEALYRKIRKCNGIASTIVQGVDDYFKNRSTAALYDNANWKWNLMQEAASISKAKANGNINITLFEEQLMKSIKNHPPQFGDSYIRSSETSIVVRLKTDPLSHWTYTNSPKDIAKVTSIMKKENIDGQVARLYLALQFDGHSDEVALRMAKNGQLKDIDLAQKIAFSELAAALVIKEPNSIKVYSRAMVSKANRDEVFCYEVYPHIQNQNSISYRDIEKVKDDISNFIECEIAVITQILHKIANRKSKYAIALSLKGLIHGAIIEAIVDFVEQNEKLRNRLILEIPLTDMDPKDEPFVKDAIDRFKAVDIGISNVGLKSTSRIAYVYSFDLDYIKISKSLFQDSKDEVTKSILVGLAHISRSKNTSLIASDISSEDIIEILEDHPEIKYLQGFHISDQEQVH